MRTILGVLSALAAVWSAQAVIGPTFNKDSCTTNSFSTDAYQATPTSDGAWNCINFDVSTTGVATMRIEVTAANEGAELQFLMWNNGRAGGDLSASPPDHRWNRGEDEFVYILRSQGEQGNDEVDISGFDPDVFDYSNRTTRINLSSVRGWTSGARNDGVYAWTPSSATSNQGKNYQVGLNLGMNFLQIGHPSVVPTSGSPGTVADFEGVFMWRFVNPNDDSALFRYVPFLGTPSPAVKADLGGPLTVGEARTVSDYFLPGTYVNLDIDATFAKVGLPIKGFKVQVEVLGNGVGNITSLGSSGSTRGEGQLTEPEGYTFKDATVSKPGAPPASIITLGTSGSNSRVAYYNITDFSIRAREVERVGMWDSSSNVNTFTADYVGPLDVTGATSTAFGSLRVRLPTFQAVDADNNPVSSDLYNWGDQTSPFLNVRITIVRVDMYPMLSELSNKRFRNWDDSEDSGHSATDINNQEPFGLYLLRTDAYWYDGRIVASGVANLNALTNAGATTITAANSPACQPLWEIQEISTYSTGGSTYGRHNNGWFGTFSNAASSSLSTATFYDDMTSSGLLTNKKVGKIRSTFWNGQYGKGLADYSTTRSMWFLVRISAAPAMTSAGLDDCGSNWIEVGSASFEADSAIGQCRASSECMVASADNPNKDQASDSANGAANRFSTCQVVQSLRRGKVVPTTKCVECFSNNQCDGGQYCHLDYGMCSNAGGTYFCDKSSYDLYGICREKDTSILGSRCRPSNNINGPAFNYAFPGVSPAGGAVVPGSTQYSWSGQASGASAGSIAAPQKLFVVKGDPKNKDFAQGSNGACGEFRYYNSSHPPTGVFETGTSTDPWISIAGQVRTTLWNGLCVDMGGNKGHRCVECLPGSSFNGAGSNGFNPGKVCLNGLSHSARDVDGTVRSYTQDTRASTELGTTMMVVLLIILFWVYMYTEAKRWRIANGKKPMSCCECILCCGACADEGGAKSGGGDSSKTAPAPASDDAATAPAGGDADQA